MEATLTREVATVEEIKPGMISEALRMQRNSDPERIFDLSTPIAHILSHAQINTVVDIAQFLALAVANTYGLTLPAEIVATRRINGRVDAVGRANKHYAGFNGNREEKSGDGYLYRGRGLCRIIGRATYRRYANHLQIPIDKIPEQLEDWHTAVAVGAHHFTQCVGRHRDAGRYKASDIPGLPHTAIEEMTDTSTRRDLIQPLQYENAIRLWLANH